MDKRSHLVQLAQAGDRDAARSLIDQNQASVYRLAFSILDDPGDATRATYESGVAQLENLAAYPGPEAHTAWLYRLTLQVCLDVLRARRVEQSLRGLRARMERGLQSLPVRLRGRSLPANPPVPAAGLPEPDPLLQAVANLDEKLRLPLVLRYAHDLLPHEVALVLNWRDRSVQARLNQARRRLLGQSEETEFAPLESVPKQEGIDHFRAARLLEAVADYSITDADNVLLQRHLKNCDFCQATSHRLKALEDTLRIAFHAHLDQQPLPAEGLGAQIIERRRQRTARRHSFSLGGALVVTLLVVGLILLLPNTLPAQILPPLPTPTLPPLAPTSTAPILATNLPPISRRDLLSQIYPGKIAFMTYSELGDHLFTIEPQKGIFQKITSGVTENSSPAWSPDGRQIAYLKTPASNVSNQIFVTNPDGSNSRQITRPGFPYRPFPGVPADGYYPHFGPPHWSPDGQSLVVAVWASNTDHFLAVMPLSGQNARIVPVQGLDLELASMSPDGSAVAYLGSNDQILWLWQPNLPVLEGQNPRKLSFGSWEMVFGLAWSPDSSQIALLGGVHAADIVQVDLQIFDTSGVEIQSDPVSIGELTHPTLRNSQLSWSPDGRYLAMIPLFTDGDLVYGRILVIQVGLKGALPLVAGTSAEISGISWSPDGRWLAYSVGSEIWAASMEAFENHQDHLVRLTPSAGFELNWQKVN